MRFPSRLEEFSLTHHTIFRTLNSFPPPLKSDLHTSFTYPRLHKHYFFSTASDCADHS